ncbi:ABC transporter substrate-binding protein [Terrilactibacillus sp. BCM23-1]|uniref:ABC transporter substrate-binding protein n=1 Tax=Terrilactibacillus tamarindi TaxID=2599694 RepID=A0A6N8CTK4_9BACI|nr:ABC transporter substrate-binding protein [Terrilactibacillus tamarindi]MTT32383.1 ABC transporter substrate-binding protein [Terrilactibacillus tamarindi]
MNRKFFSSLSILILSLVVILAGCSSSSTSPGSSSRSSKFVYGINGDPGNSVNVISTSDRFGLMEIKAIYSPLYMYNGKNNVKYFLAKSMTPSKDLLTYTAKLRKGVKWHDGKPFTADDVVFTYQQMLNKSAGGWARSQLIFDNKPIQVKKVDDYTVKFILPKVSMGAIEALGNIFIMPKHIYEGEKNIATSAKNAHPIGTGPYKFGSYKAGQNVTFERNNDYFLGKPNIKTIVYRIIEDQNTANLALQNGEINAFVVQPADIGKFDKSKIKIVPYDEGRVGYMAFNLASKPVQSKQVRQAIAYALNREEMVKASYLSSKYAKPVYSFLPSTATYQTDHVNHYDHNVKKAKQLLAKSGVKKLTLRLAYTGNDPFQQKQAAVMQQNLKDAGITLKLVGMDGPALSQKLYKTQTDFDMYLNGYIMGIDPDTFNGLFTTGSTHNYMHYSNPTVDRLFNEGRIERDDQKRKQIYEKIQQLISDDAAFYPIVSNKRILAIDSNIKGIDEAGLVPVYTFEDMSKLSY